VKFFKVVPTWIGFSDYTGKKPQITELFFSWPFSHNLFIFSNFFYCCDRK
jgi:hypothetical protein